jgi:hypothetical protein
MRKRVPERSSAEKANIMAQTENPELDDRESSVYTAWFRAAGNDTILSGEHI